MIEPSRQASVITAAGHAIALDNGSVLVDGQERPVPPTPSIVLHVLASQPGRVFSRAELLRLAWHGRTDDEHVVEVTVGRLRRALGPAAAAVQTVVKRGYRLAVDP